MALYTEQSLKSLAKSYSVKKSMDSSHIILESTQNFSASKIYDIFLSHRYLDSDVVLGLSLDFESLGYSVYIDWIEDPQLDRSRITKSTAATLKIRMSQCKCLFYAITDNSKESLWMPWELGFMDGHKDKVAICPITREEVKQYNGQEYLGIYPYVTKELTDKVPKKEKLWINESPDIYVVFDNWLKGSKPTKH